MEGAAVATAQQDVRMEIPTKDRSGSFFVLFTGDLIDGTVKASNPLWEAGGILRPEVQTLKYRHGYIRRCEITALRPQTFSERASFIQSEERKHLAKTVNMQVGDGEVVELGKNKDGTHDGLLRTIIYPVDEINTLVSQVNGIVQMPCSNGAEAAKAQYFLFSDWDDYVAGQKHLPAKMATLEAHFQQRRAAAVGAWELRVADAAIKSCVDFRTWGNLHAGAVNATFNQMKVSGHAWPYAPVTEQVFGLLGIPRQDTITQDQSDKMDRLTDNIGKLAEITLANAQAKGTSVDAPTAEDFAEFQAWKASKAKQGVETASAPQNAPSAPQSAAIDESDVEPINDGDEVSIEGRIGTVVAARSQLGMVKVKFIDNDEEKLCKRKSVVVIPKG